MKSEVRSQKSEGLGESTDSGVLRRLALASSFCLLPSAFGWAAHPFITDDAGTQGAGNWQLELMAERGQSSRTADVGPVHQRSRSTEFTPVVTYGLRDTLDIALGASYLRNHVTENAAPTEDASGKGDSTLEVKWRFYDRDGLSFALKPGISLPTGDENRGLGTGRTSWGVNLIADFEAEPWVWLANVAYTHARFKLPQDQMDNRKDLWRLSGGAEYIVRKDWRLVGELGVRTNELRNDPFYPGRHAQYAMAGAIYSPTEKLDFDIGLRKGLNRAEADTAILIGATFRW